MATNRGFDGMIDEPSPYTTLETWERHLAMIEAMDFAPDAVPSKADCIRHAREMIAEIKAFEMKHGKRQKTA